MDNKTIEYIKGRIVTSPPAAPRHHFELAVAAEVLFKAVAAKWSDQLARDLSDDDTYVNSRISFFEQCSNKDIIARTQNADNTTTKNVLGEIYTKICSIEKTGQQTHDRVDPQRNLRTNVIINTFFFVAGNLTGAFMPVLLEPQIEAFKQWRADKPHTSEPAPAAQRPTLQAILARKPTLANRRKVL